ncbi:MAG: DUF1559 domain-containing protein [Planctomycetia bacterium]|nr:DUF1559 domain-containing protein [Planctomycetia bacterium]
MLSRSAFFPEFRQRAGFTLVELLVVIAIIGMLVGLLLPAVQQAREAARQMQCNNHLRQMALACLNLETAQKNLPSGGWYYSWCGDPDRGFSYAQPGAWTFSILPFLEQNALFQMGSDGQPDTITSEQKKGSETVITTPIPVFFCPSRRTCQVSYTKFSSATFQNAQLPSGEQNVMKTDYAGNCGSTHPGHITEVKDMNDAMEILRKNQWKPVGTGVIYHGSQITLSEIRDGTSNTYLCGEKYMASDRYIGTAELLCGGDDATGYSGGDGDTLRSTSQSHYPVQDRPQYDTAPSRFGSAHAGSFGMAMCDGSVQRISYSIEPETHENLGIRNDGQVATWTP